jgi:hypothetical protein
MHICMSRRACKRPVDGIGAAFQAFIGGRDLAFGRAALRCAVRLTDQVLLFLPGAAIGADDEPWKIQIAAFPSWVSFQRMAGDVCKAEGVKGITCPSSYNADPVFRYSWFASGSS